MYAKLANLFIKLHLVACLARLNNRDVQAARTNGLSLVRVKIDLPELQTSAQLDRAGRRIDHTRTDPAQMAGIDIGANAGQAIIQG